MSDEDFIMWWTLGGLVVLVAIFVALLIFAPK